MVGDTADGMQDIYLKWGGGHIGQLLRHRGNRNS